MKDVKDALLEVPGLSKEAGTQALDRMMKTYSSGPPECVECGKRRAGAPRDVDGKWLCGTCRRNQ